MIDWLKRIPENINYWIKSNVSNMKNHTPKTNLSGDRDIEWSWIVSQMPSGPGEALDFGPGGSQLGLIAARRGFNVISIDLQSVHWDYSHPNLRFTQGDILNTTLQDGHFDMVINCSVVEHVGLVGRYGVTLLRNDGDIESMTRLKALMKPDGVMLLTIPVGQDATFAPLHRVYGKERLPRLLDGYSIEKKEYWVKDDKNRWILTEESDAINRKPQRYLYGLGCFVLRKRWGKF